MLSSPVVKLPLTSLYSLFSNCLTSLFRLSAKKTNYFMIFYTVRPSHNSRRFFSHAFLFLQVVVETSGEGYLMNLPSEWIYHPCDVWFMHTSTTWIVIGNNSIWAAAYFLLLFAVLNMFAYWRTRFFVSFLKYWNSKVNRLELSCIHTNYWNPRNVTLSNDGFFLIEYLPSSGSALLKLKASQEWFFLWQPQKE